MWKELHGGNRQTVGHETQGTQATLGSRLLGKSRLAQPSFEENQLRITEDFRE
jgi:hypothetical protein